ncbi:hypothetical protein ACUDOC_29410 [Pseudomonas aeruginosa]|uniref:hypothetical protein n=1 Tax=Pseudomonas aeruginosa TaxID=287 RepID=UPI002147B763|nr:hypothetical protein [Pseudomonas aeruginosa]MCQ9839227.1 hypothetical protein [Pseudomonas aeruginosa]MCQ9867311.1 hypothetical protein [Pseudomonas aeruginosa]MCS8054807.1 hypothetical protein [Pseudomonas aeruginosa]MCT0837271.1 hypothetical protein [Pseudomonas aeruginosa]
MKDILRDFLEEGKKALQVVPFDFFPSPEEAKGNYGILPLFYTQWAASKSLLLRSDEIVTCLGGLTEFSKKIIAVRDILGESLLPAHFKEVGNSFTQSYYRPGWKHFYLRDFGSVFPDFDCFENVPDTPDNLMKIAALVSGRFEEWQLQK